MSLRRLRDLIFVAAGFSAAASPARAACVRIAVAPPPTDDRALGEWVADQVATQLPRATKGTCREVMPYWASAATFDVVGASTSFPRTAEDLGERQVAYLVDDLRVTHLLFPGAPQRDGRVAARLYRIDDGKRLVLERRFEARLGPEAIKARRATPTSRFLSRIAPNAFTLGGTKTKVNFDVPDYYGEPQTTTRGLIPPVVSSMTVTRVEHRYAFNRWDVAGSLFPGQYLFGIDQDEVFRPREGVVPPAGSPDPLRLHIETYGGCGTANAQGSLFSPIGTTYGGVGWGPCAIWLRNEKRAPATYVRTAGRFFFGHRVFINDRWFFSVDTDMVIFDGRLYRSTYASSSLVQRGGASLGYYIEDAEVLASALWNYLL